MTTQAEAPLRIKLHASDNVAVIVNEGGLPKGTLFDDGLTLREDVPQAHKVALCDIAAGEAVVRYGVPIGFAVEDIACGSWVTEARLRMPPSPRLADLRYHPQDFPACEPLTGFSFEGYRNEDGSVGTRNILAIGTCVQCVGGVADYVVNRIRQELLPRYPHVDEVLAVQHIYGCGVAIDAPGAHIPIHTLHNILRNPNFGAMPLLLSLGCEKLPPEKLFPATAGFPQPASICLQDESLMGFDGMVDAILQQAASHLEKLDQRRRVTCPASALRVGMQCGGSDAFSGITANPALGKAADLIVQAGGTVFFSEVTEVRDGVERIVARAASQEVFDALVREMAWYDAYLDRGGVDRSANTTPGNKQGGLNNITEKTMGSFVKSGSSPIVGVVAPGERLPEQCRGLYYVATPASDFVCGTLQVAAGMNVHVFSTGRGTPYGLREVPVIKVSTRDALARRWHDLVDFNAGGIATGRMSIDEAGMTLFQMILDVAGGTKKPCSDVLGLYNSLALFNPAPIT